MLPVLSALICAGDCTLVIWFLFTQFQAKGIIKLIMPVVCVVMLDILLLPW